MIWIWARITRRMLGEEPSRAVMAFRQAGKQAGRDCRSEIEVVPLAVNLWNTATGRAIRSIIRFELRPSNCARVIRATRLLLPFRYIVGRKLQSIGSSFMITTGRHPVVTFRSHQLHPRNNFMPFVFLAFLYYKLIIFLSIHSLSIKNFKKPLKNRLDTQLPL